MKTYAFRIVVEPDEDRWSAYCPSLEKPGTATWGKIQAEELTHVREVAEMVLKEFVGENETIPAEPG